MNSLTKLPSNATIGFPILTAEKFAEAVGLPIGVVEAQMDRRLLPIAKIGKRRFVNIEILRQSCLEGFPSK
jgi:hypothetical protein